jgi:protein-L-isoaspartate(D-aspartate) O-methyltransferase
MNFDAARLQMVEQQVRAWNVLDEQVLATMTRIPREHFVPEEYRDLAFADTQIPIGHDEVMLTPQLEGRLLQALALAGDEHVLEIGTGTGFLTACLARLGGRVRSLDIHEEFIESARAKLSAIDIGNVELACADAMTLEDKARYDAIAVTGSLPEYDPRFQQALKIGGRLFVVVGQHPVMEARLVSRVADKEWLTDILFETSIRPLSNAPVTRRFEF